MKNSFLALIILSLVFSCKKSNNITPNGSIIGKWQQAYVMQSLQPDGSWSDWQTINTFDALPTYEFTKNGRFLLDGKIAETCCNPGSFYKLSNDTLTFTYDKTPDCRTVKCADPNTKIIVKLVDNELILIESSGRYKVKYKRVN